MTADLILGSLHSEPVLARLAADGPKRVAAALRAMVSALLLDHVMICDGQGMGRDWGGG
jgi:hypothetical protein